MVGIVSNGVLRHVVQTAPVWATVLLALRRSPWHVNQRCRPCHPFARAYSAHFQRAVCRAGLGSIPGEPVVAPQADPDVPMLKVAKAEYEKLQ